MFLPSPSAIECVKMQVCRGSFCVSVSTSSSSRAGWCQERNPKFATSQGAPCQGRWGSAVQRNGFVKSTPNLSFSCKPVAVDPFAVADPPFRQTAAVSSAFRWSLKLGWMYSPSVTSQLCLSFWPRRRSSRCRRWWGHRLVGVGVFREAELDGVRRRNWARSSRWRSCRPSWWATCTRREPQPHRGRTCRWKVRPQPPSKARKIREGVSEPGKVLVHLNKSSSKVRDELKPDLTGLWGVLASRRGQIENRGWFWRNLCLILFRALETASPRSWGVHVVNTLSLVSASCIVTTHSCPILNFPLLVPISQLVVRLY